MIGVTTIERSRKLLALGVSPKSADMYYFVSNPNAIMYWHKEKGVALLANTDTPAWSLFALLELLPHKITIDHKEYELKMHKWHDPELGIIRYEFSYSDYHLNTVKGAFADSVDPLDAAFDLLCWVLNNNHTNR